MKRLFFISFVVFLLASCDSSVKVTTEQDEPIYEEFTTQENEEIEEVKEVENTDEIDNVIPQQNETTNLSSDNLNEFLASPEQTVIFSIKIVKNGKVLSLLTDANEKYLIYRFGKPNNIELQYPKIADNTSWSKFKFQSYNTKTENLLHISFTNIDTEYNIYYNEYTQKPTGNKVGVQVMLPNETIDIRGNFETITGSLNFFVDNDKVRK